MRRSAQSRFPSPQGRENPGDTGRRRPAQISGKNQAEADISAISGGRTRFESGAYGKLEACVGEELQRQAEDAIRTAVLKNSCDIFGFGNLLYQKYPSFWKGLDWEKQMAECSYGSGGDKGSAD